MTVGEYDKSFMHKYVRTRFSKEPSAAYMNLQLQALTYLDANSRNHLLIGVDTVYLHLDTQGHSVIVNLAISDCSKEGSLEMRSLRLGYGSLHQEKYGAHDQWCGNEIGDAWLYAASLLSHFEVLDSIRFAFCILPEMVTAHYDSIHWVNHLVYHFLSSLPKNNQVILDIGIIFDNDRIDFLLMATELTTLRSAEYLLPPGLVDEWESHVGRDVAIELTWHCLSIICRAIQEHSWAKIRLAVCDSLEVYKSLQFSWGGNTQRRFS